MHAKIMIHPFVIDIQLFVPVLDNIPADPNYSFDKILIRINRVFENDNISPIGILNGYDTFTPVRNFHPVNKFVHQDVITDLKRLLHRA